MTHKITYRNVDDNTVDIYIEDENGIEKIGQATRNSISKWKLKAFFPVDIADIEKINTLYDGPIEAGRELVKAWEYYRSYNLNDTAEFFIGDLFK